MHPSLLNLFKRKRAIDATPGTPTSSNKNARIDFTAAESLCPNKTDVPAWATRLQADLGGFTFSSDFTTYKCACGFSGSNVASKQDNILKGSNARAHRRSVRCLYDKQQSRLFEKREPKLDAAEFKVKLVNFIVDNNVPFSVVENESFRDLVLSGAGREHLTVPSRRTIGREIDALYESVYKQLQTALSRAESRISITFDLWTDRRTRGYIGITGHYFDRELVLRAPLLAIEHMPKVLIGHTAARIVETVSSVLHALLGDDWKAKMHCVVTDGASNVTAASVQIGESRRCLQHGLQLVLKHFCTTQRDVASAMACCNYLAKLSGLSQKFQSHVGTIPAGVATRWNSYIKAAYEVYQRADKIRNYANSPHCKGESKEAILARLKFLDEKDGYVVLHDLIVLLKPLMDITIDEEAELYITSSAVIPRLCAAKQRIDEIFGNAARGDNCGGQILNMDRVKQWKDLVNDLWAEYLDGFVNDEVFLCASLLDARWAVKLNDSARRAAVTCLRSRLEREYERRIRDLHARAADADSAARAPARGANNNNAGVQVADGRAEAVESNVDAFASALLGNDAVEQRGEQNRVIAVVPTFRNVDDEERVLFEKIVALNKNRDFSMLADPMSIFRDPLANLQLARAVALDVLSVPAGEAPSERIFSIASRIIGTNRAKMSARSVTRNTFIKKNRRALAD